MRACPVLNVDRRKPRAHTQLGSCVTSGGADGQAHILFSGSVAIFLGASLLAFLVCAEPARSAERHANAIEAFAAAAGQVQPSEVVIPITTTTVFTTYLPMISAPFIWRSDFENGFAEWGDPHRQGGTTEVVPDPTSS